MLYQVLFFLLLSVTMGKADVKKATLKQMKRASGKQVDERDEPDFRCDIYGYIYMVNPDREVFQFAHAVDYLMIGDETDASSIVCQTYVSGLIDPTITIEPSANGYCGKGRAIMLTISNTSIHETIITSIPFKRVFIVRCNDISIPTLVNVTQKIHSKDGVDDVPTEFDIEDIGVSVNLNQSLRSRLIPCCAVDAKIKQVVSTEVGTHLLWILDVHKDYLMRPLTCRAHAGKSATGSPSAVLLDEGCSVDDRLVTQREYVDRWGLYRRAYVMNLFAFHFYSSPYVTIVCHTRLCPLAAANYCEWECPFDNNRRKRRHQRSSLISRDESAIETAVLTVLVRGDLNTGSIPGISNIWILLLVWALRSLS